MWTWDQSAGSLTRFGNVVSNGYSGTGRGRNSPAMQAAKNVGPIPRGHWRMTRVYDSPQVGPYAIELVPGPGAQTCGRGDFRIHGDNVQHDASHGCIILPRAIRELIWKSGDRDLMVIE